MCSSSPAPAPSQPTSTTVTNVNLPEYAKPYVESTLGKAQALTDINQNPYQSYQGQRVADFSPMQQQAFQRIGEMGPAGQIGQGTALASAAGINALGAQDQAGALGQQALGYGGQGSMYGGMGARIGQQASRLAGQGLGYGGMGAGYGAQAADMSGMGFGAGQQYAEQATNPYAQQAYMSPYIQNALQPQLAELGRQFDITGQQEKGRATAAGAFGGTRQALMQAENDRNRNMAMNQVIGQGYQNAFDKAQQAQQFGANLGLQGQQLGYQGLGMGIQGAQSGLAGLQAANQLYGTGLQGAQAGMQGAQIGQAGVGQAINAGQYGLQGLGQATAAAGTLGQLGQNQYGQQMGINAAQQQAGAQQQAQTQQGLSNAYQDFLNQQNYPYKQLGFMSDIIHGTQMSGGAGSSAMYQAPPNVMGQVAGLGLGLGSMMSGASKLAGKAGGDVRGFAEGGGVAGIGASTAPVNYRDPSTELGVKSMLTGAQQGQPQPMSLEQLTFLNKQMQQLHTPQAIPQNTTVAEDIARKILVESQAKRMQEAQAMMPQQAPQQGGLMNLPVDNFNPDNYAGGGIVAFAGGDAVESPYPDSTLLGEEDTSSAGIIQGIRARAKDRRAAVGPEQTPEEVFADIEKFNRLAGVTGKVGESREAALRKGISQMEEDKDQARRDFLMNLGFNAAASAAQPGVPRAGGILGSLVQPFAVGAAKAAPEYMAAQKDLRKLNNEREKELGEIDNLRRAEALGKVKDATGKIATRIARLDKIESDIEDNEGKAAIVAAGTERSQAEIAARATESAADRASREKITNLEIQARLAAANAPGSEERLLTRIAKETGKTLAETYERVLGARYGSGQERTDVAGLKVLLDKAENRLLTTKDPVKRAKLEQDMLKYETRLEELAGMRTTPAARKPITKAEYDALPSGPYTAPDGSQRVKP